MSHSPRFPPNRDFSQTKITVKHAREKTEKKVGEATLFPEMFPFSRPDSIQFLEISTQRLDISGISSVGFSLLPLSFSVRKGTDVRQQREFSASPKAPLFSRHHTFPAVAAGNKRGKSFCPLLTFFFFSPFSPCEAGRGYRCDDLPFPFLFLHKSLVSNSPDSSRFFRFGKRKKIEFSIFFFLL